MMFRLAGKALLKMIKRWPSMISKCVLCLTENLRSPKSPEYVVLGSCAVLATQTVLKHLTMVVIPHKLLTTDYDKMRVSDMFLSFQDPKAFSSFILGILSR